MSPRVQRALISVSDKHGLTEFAQGLRQLGIEIFASGGTAAHLQAAGVAVRDVADYTGFPEMMDGRLKTLHPKIHGGILCRRNRDDDMQSIAGQDIVPFELVVVNLYPFQRTAKRPDAAPAEVVEQIDIGGPTLVRAAAKNHAFVTIATDPDQYGSILGSLRQEGATTAEHRFQLAAAAFAHTAEYDHAIATYFARRGDRGRQPSTPRAASSDGGIDFPESMTISLRRKSTLRYGENPHQAAALYEYSRARPGAHLLSARQLGGKELSYNNLLDADAALTIARGLPAAGVAVVKHNNPCGAASDSVLARATRKAMEGDSVSAFGSILAFNQPVDAGAAEYLATPGLFVEAIVAPSFAPAALEILTTRPKWKNNVRLLEVGPLEDIDAAAQLRQIEGGFLVQAADLQPDSLNDWQVVTRDKPTDRQTSELQFAWAAVRYVKSNAIVLSRERTLVGVGAGQMSRVDSVQIAIRKAGERARGAVLASDAFFPFPDSIQEAAAAGVAAVIQPGGSRRDQEVIDACNQHDLPMVFTGRRHFRH